MTSQGKKLSEAMSAKLVLLKKSLSSPANEKNFRCRHSTAISYLVYMMPKTKRD